MALTEQQVRDIIKQGETEQVELKSTVRDAPYLARIISGFANGKGGLLVVGVQPAGHISGCDRPLLTGVFEAARKQINRTQIGSLEFIKLDGHEIGLVHVNKSEKLVTSSAGVFLRNGRDTLSMTADQIFSKATGTGGEHTLRSLSQLISEQMRTINRLHHAHEAANSWKTKLKDFALSGLVGAILGVILSKIFMK